MQHILPSGIKRIRHYWLLANPSGQRLAQAKAALHMPAKNRAAQEDAQDFIARVAKINISQCPACAHGRLAVVQTLPSAKRLPDPLGQTQTTRPAANSRGPPATAKRA